MMLNHESLPSSRLNTPETMVDVGDEITYWLPYNGCLLVGGWDDGISNVV